MARPSPPSSPGLNAEDKRRQILDAAAKIFSEKGYHAAGIADIAARLGMGHGTFYRYFSNKLDIFSSIILQIVAAVQEVTAAESPESTNTLGEYRTQIERFGQKLFQLFEANEHLARLLFVEAPGVGPEQRAQVDQMIDLFGEYTQSYLRNGVAKGFLRADLDIPVTALAMNAITLEGLRRLASAADRPHQRELWIAVFRKVVFEGIAVRRE